MAKTPDGLAASAPRPLNTLLPSRRACHVLPGAGPSWPSPAYSELCSGAGQGARDTPAAGADRRCTGGATLG